MPPDAPTTPGPTATPAAPPATPAAPPAASPDAARPSSSVTRRTYATSPKRAAAPPTVAAPSVASSSPATAQPAPEVRPVGSSSAATPGADSAAAAAPAAAGDAGKPPDGAADAAPPAPAKEVLDEAEGAKRLATLTRAERRLQEEQRSHRDRLAVADAVAQVLGPANATPQAVQQVLRQAAMVAQGQKVAHQDPIGFLQRVFGVDPRRVYQLAIDGAIAEGAKPPEARAKDDVRAVVREAIAPYEEQLRQAEARTRQEQTARQADDYQRQTLAPMVQAPEFSGIRQFCALTGSDPSRELYNAMVTRFQQTGRAPEPKALAQELEQAVQSRLRQAGIAPAPPSGTSATSAGQAPKRVEAPAAPSEAPRRPAADPSPRAPALTRQRLNGKPYHSRPL